VSVRAGVVRLLDHSRVDAASVRLCVAVAMALQNRGMAFGRSRWLAEVVPPGRRRILARPFSSLVPG
jgi:hypothetical protein